MYNIENRVHCFNYWKKSYLMYVTSACVDYKFIERKNSCHFSAHTQQQRLLIAHFIYMKSCASMYTLVGTLVNLKLLQQKCYSPLLPRLELGMASSVQSQQRPVT